MQFAAYRKRRLIWFSLNESKITRLEPVVSKKELYLPFTSQPHNTKVQEKQRFEEIRVADVSNGLFLFGMIISLNKH
ncbi:uncharacterized protein LOC126590041 isoform X2 [Malus sylvestris]|nr:uncharacterized protein LOC126590041 isoform X2 [Malus sylvestris]